MHPVLENQVNRILANHHMIVSDKIMLRTVSCACKCFNENGEIRYFVYRDGQFIFFTEEEYKELIGKGL